MSEYQIRFPSTVAALALVLGSASSIIHAADLFHLVGDDVAACVHLTKVDQQWDRMAESEFSNRLQQASFFDEWVNSNEYSQLELVKTVIETASKQPLRKSVHDLFGDEVVIAWYHERGSKPDLAGNSVVLLEAESPQAIDTALATWNILEKQRTSKRDHNGTSYTHSVKDSAGPNARGVFHVTIGQVFAISVREELIHRVIDLAADSKHGETSPPGTLASHEHFQAALARRPEAEVAAVYLNPRVLASELARGDRGMVAVSEVAARCHWLTLRLSSSPGAESNLELEFVADYDSSNAPSVWKQWLDVAIANQLPESRIPSDSVFAMTGHLDTVGIAELIRNALPPEDNQPRDMIRARRVIQGLLMGLDPLNDLLPGIGPAWLSYVVARDPDQSKSFPADMLIAVQLAKSDVVTEDSGTGEAGDADLRKGLDSALLSGLTMLSAVHNTQALQQKISVVRHRTHDGATIRFADPVAFFQPAYTITEDYVLLATNPDLCASFLDGSTATKGDGVRSSDSGNLQMLMTNSAAAREMLKQQRDWFIRQAHKDGVQESEAERRLQELEQFLQLLDEARLSASIDESTVSVKVKLVATESGSE